MMQAGYVLKIKQWHVTFQVDREVGTWTGVDGEFTTSKTTLTLGGVIQPATVADLNTLPEGERQGEVIKVWSYNLLQQGNGVDKLSDFIHYKGSVYKVVKARDFNQSGIWMALASKVT